MDISSDVWNQVALEASQLYFTEDGKSPFANTVCVWQFCENYIAFYGLNS